MGQNGRAGSGKGDRRRPAAAGRLGREDRQRSVFNGAGRRSSGIPSQVRSALRARPPSRCPLPASRSSVLRRDHRAVGGFFEEIPAFVVVVLSVSMFLVAAYSTYGRMGDDGRLSSLQDDCQRLCRAFRGLPAALDDGQGLRGPANGIFSADKLDALNSSALRGELRSPNQYNLTVFDLSSGRNWSFGEAPPASASMRVKVSSAAVVAVEGGHRDPARLEVVMWE